MIKNILISLMLVFCSDAFSQQMAKYEYWFDSDIGSRKEQTMSGNDISLYVDVSALSDGMHSLSFRAADSNGFWSSPTASYFIKAAKQNEHNKISQIEYWIDNNYVNRTVAATDGNISVDIDAASLSDGMHTISYRVKDELGKWSIPCASYFVKAAKLERPNTISQIEYWIDNNYGKRVNKPCSENVIDLLVDAADLSTGAHILTFRTSDSRGKWSSPQSYYFIKPLAKSMDNEIMAYRYWFNGNDDDAVMMKLENPVSPYMLDLKLQTDGMYKQVTPENIAVTNDANGKPKVATKNTFNIMFQDKEGRWTNVERDTFLTIVNETADLTPFIRNPKADADLANWTVDGASSIQTNGHWNGTDDKYFRLGNISASSWESSISQTISGLPAGTYSLSVCGRLSQEASVDVSINGYSISLPSYGDTGGEIWENADAGTVEKNANAGKGYGWSCRTLTFTTDGNPFTLLIAASSDTSEQWADIDDITLSFTTSCNLEVGFADGIDLDDYSGSKLVLETDKNKYAFDIKQTQRTYKFNGLSSDEKYKLSLQNLYGQAFASKQLTLDNGDNTVIMENISSPVSVYMKIVDKDGNDVSKNVKTIWMSESADSLKSGNVITDVPEGCRMAYSIILDESLGTEYKETGNVAFTVSSTNKMLTHTLTEIPSVTVSGCVMSEYGVPLKAALAVEQILNGKYSKKSLARTADDGSFSLQLLNDSTLISATAEGYANSIFTTDNFDLSKDIGSIRLKEMNGKKIYVSYAFTACGNGNLGETSEWYGDSPNVDYCIYNRTSNRQVENFVVQNDCIFLPETVQTGDMLEITVHSKKNIFQPVTAVVAVCETETMKAIFNLVEKGGLKVTYTSSANGKSLCLLYDASGMLKANVVFSNKEAVFNHYESGSYHVVTMGNSQLMCNLPTLDDFDTMELVEGRDYIVETVNVDDGVIQNVTIGEIPALDEKVFYYTTSNTIFTTNKTKVVAGNYVTITSKIELKPEYAETADELKLIVDIPEGCALVDNSVIIRTSSTAYTVNGRRLEIPLSKDNYTERIRFCVMPQQSGTFTPNAFLSVNVGRDITQSIGNVAFTAEDLAITVPSRTSRHTINVSGMAMAGSDVIITDNGEVIGTTKAMANGHWTCVCKLDKPYNLTTHPVQASINSPLGLTYKTAVKYVTVDVNYNDVKTVTMINTAHTAADLSLYEYVTVFDFQNPSAKAPVYWYWPNYPDFTFCIDFADNDTTAVSNVSIDVQTSSGAIVPLKAKYDIGKKLWVANGQFHSQSLPVNVSVNYLPVENALVIDRDFLDDNRNEYEGQANEYIEALDAIDALSKKVADYFEGHKENVNNSDFFAQLAQFNVDDSDIGDSDISPEVQNLIRDLQNAGTSGELEKTLKSLREYTDNISNTLAISKEEAKASLEYGIMGDSDDISLTRGRVEQISENQLMAEGFTVVETTDKGKIYAKIGVDETVIIDPKYNEKTVLTNPKAKIDFSKMSMEELNDYDEDKKIKFLKTCKEIVEYFDDAVIPIAKGYRNDCRAIDRALQKVIIDNVFPDLNFALCYSLLDARIKRCQMDVWLKRIGKASRTCKSLGALGNALEAADLFNDIVKDDVSLENLLGNIYMCTNSEDFAMYEKKIAVAKAQAATLNCSFLAINLGVGGLVSAGIAAAPATLGWSIVAAGVGIGITYLSEHLLDEMKKKLVTKVYNDIKNEIDWEKCQKDIGNRFPGLISRESGCLSAEHVQDPSGYVYEAVTSNRLEGVTVTVYKKEQKEDMYGEKYDEITKWNADAYLQSNPIITDANGYYAWDVPQGLWRVKYEKAGYETVFSDWLPVPPPQLDINVGMSHAVNPKVCNVRGYESGLVVEFSKYMKPELFVENCITVTRNGIQEAGHIELQNAETDPYENRTFVSKVKFVPDMSFNITDNVVITIHKGLKSYCDAPLLDDYSQTVVIEPEISGIVMDSLICVPYNGSREVVVKVVPAKASSGKKLNVKLASAMIAVTESDVTIDNNGEAKLKVNGLLPGATAMLISVDNTDVRSLSKLEVVEKQQLMPPVASIVTGTIVPVGTLVELTSNIEDAIIYYTLDGSCPCNESTRLMYKDPIAITSDVTIKAITVKKDYYDSEVVTFEYIVQGTGLYKVADDTETAIRVCNGTISVINGDGASLAIYKLDGNVVYSNSCVHNVSIENLQLGNVYLITLRGKNGYLFSKKVLVI